MIGPVLGGLFVTYWSWRGIFLVNLPLGVLLLALGTIFIPDIARRPDRHLDVRGIVLVGVTLLSAMFGVAFLGSAGSDPLSLAFIAPECAAVAGAVAFVRHSARAESPFISLRFLTGRGFGVMNLINFLYGSAALGFAPLVPLYAQERYGLSSLAAGHAADVARARHDRDRRAGCLPAAAHRVPVADRDRILPDGGRHRGDRGRAAGGLLALRLAGHRNRHRAAPAWAPRRRAGKQRDSPARPRSTPPPWPGLRGMFRQAGAISAVSITAAIMARSSIPASRRPACSWSSRRSSSGRSAWSLFVPEHRGRW